MEERVPAGVPRVVHDQRVVRGVAVVDGRAVQGDVDGVLARAVAGSLQGHVLILGGERGQEQDGVVDVASRQWLVGSVGHFRLLLSSVGVEERPFATCNHPI